MSAARDTAGAPRNPSSSRCSSGTSSIAAASSCMSGARRRLRALIKSVSTPPAPSMTIGPNWGSWIAAEDQLDPGRPHRLHQNLVGFGDAAPSPSRAARTSASVRRSRRTPPTSVLCTLCAILTATG